MTSETTFISYSRVDTNFVIKLAQDLRKAGVNIWLDQKDISTGDRWDKSVQNALHSCTSLIVIYSPDSVASDNVLDEVYYAIGEKRRVIPVLYKTCDIPFRLKRLQYIDFTKNHSQGIRKLVAVMTSKTGIPTEEPMIIRPKKKSESETGDGKKVNPSMKNIAENIDIEIKGNVSIGDKGHNSQKYDQKNVVKKAKIKSGGDFSLGDS